MEIDLRFQDPFFLVFEVGNGGGEDRIGKEAERKETHETPNKTKGTEGVQNVLAALKAVQQLENIDQPDLIWINEATDC